jgi:hypothetical protein
VGELVKLVGGANSNGNVAGASPVSHEGW